MKKLLILADCNIHTKIWIDILKDLFEIHLISFSPVYIEGIKNYKIDTGDINQNGGNYKYLIKLNKIRKLINIIKPDIINAHYLTSYGLIAAILKGNKPLIMSLHGTDIMVTAKKNMFFKIAAKYSLNKSDHIFSVSRIMTDELKKYVSKNQHITTIQYGINIDSVHKNSNQIKIYDFISTRNLIKNSNIDVIIEAFEKYVRLNNPDSKLVILASGNMFDYYKDVVKQKKLDNNIIMTGQVDNETLISYLNKSKFFISLTSSDGTPLSLLEAMAAGTVPIVSHIPANLEWINDGLNGFTCNIDSDSLYKKLLLINSADCHKMSDEALATVTQRGDRFNNSVTIRNTFKKTSSI